MKLRNNGGNVRNGSLLLVLSMSATAVMAALAIPVVNAKSLDTDFDRDGRDEFVVGDALADTPGPIARGHVAIIQQDRNGEMRADIWSRHRLPNSGGVQTYSRFGETVAVGDFNGDGHLDMAIGAPYATAPFREDAPSTGAVTVVYGMAGGLNQDDYQVLYSAHIGPYNNFGYSLAVGDFNADGKDDLAVGAPARALWNQQNVGVKDGPGGVSVLFGKTDGFTDGQERFFDRSQSWVAGEAQAGARFGETLATGDINGDGYDDLLMGAPDDDVTRATGKVDPQAGSVTLKLGGSTGFRSGAGVLIHDFDEADNTGDHFGSALAVGNFNGDGYDDFAIAHDGERVGNTRGAGAVTVHYGNRRNIERGRVGSGNLLYQRQSGIPGSSESFDAFGGALAAADFNNDGRDDLAIGIPYEDIERTGFDRVDAGAVLVVYGKAAGGFEVRGVNSDFHQDKPGVKGGAENNDNFGEELSVGDYDGNGVADLMIGVTGEHVNGVSGTGMIQVLHGRSYTGLRPRLDIEQIYHRGNVRTLGGRYLGTAMPH